MRLIITAVGRAKSSPEGALYQEYIKRLPWPASLREIEVRGAAKGSARRGQEGKLLLKALADGAFAVALDRKGEQLSSEEFARRMESWQDRGVRELAFLIGGAGGLDARVLERAEFSLSLGAMTWPHMLARAMLAEQLYRAASILSGHPYHRG